MFWPSRCQCCDTFFAGAQQRPRPPTIVEIAAGAGIEHTFIAWHLFQRKHVCDLQRYPLEDSWRQHMAVARIDAILCRHGLIVWHATVVC